MKERSILGVDAGSVAVSAVQLDDQGTIVRRAYDFHEGHPREVLADILNRWSEDGSEAVWTDVAATKGALPLLEAPDSVVDDHVALMKAAGRLHGRIGSLLSVGGEKFGLFTWSEAGEYRSFKGNTSCAAGTGGFLDQQAERLGLSSAAELAALAEDNIAESPKIATRCAVFAKTDLTHAQQEGFSLEAIADGLCRGLAGNLLDVLLDGEAPAEPLIVCGGVSRNSAVVRHIGDLTGTSPVVDEYAPLYGALGAAWKALESAESPKDTQSRHRRARDVLAAASEVGREDRYHYAPLELKLSPYPDFACLDSWEIPVVGRKGRYPVEVELYEELPDEGSATLGVDIGSTSTKAVVIDDEERVLLGLYTRTAGRPVDAAKGVLMALDDALERRRSDLRINACATTGSGRKLIGEILGADLILDEITAHARAAVQLDPDVDTIIEIGGQDSKFTTLSEGRVTGSVMNNVCAAGTGSFLEEQAARLGCKITDYAGRTEGVEAPLTSDRCTVFMQRDLNHLMSEGHHVDEVLASALHSVRENYLNKVAVRSRIGKKIFFQGATARIRTLVAAFEQALEKPVLVSRFCSHTGALGAALQLIDERRESVERRAEEAGMIFGGETVAAVDQSSQETAAARAPVPISRFRGVSLWKTDIPVRTEVCSLCRNACKITLAEVAGETVAYGFLCGRDYETKEYVPVAGESSDPLSERQKLFRVTPARKEGAAYTLGLPAALYMAGELPFWEKFFALLGIPTVTDRSTDPIESGRALTGAEFCAPMTGLHGRVARLLEAADYVFVPYYIDEKGPKGDKRSYCYYSQFAPALIRQVAPEERIIAPVVKTSWADASARSEIHKALSELPGTTPDFRRVQAAWNEALEWFENAKNQLAGFHAERAVEDDVNVVLLGRPYVVADAGMNKDIPRLFAEAGVRVFDIDMFGRPEGGDEDIDLPWSYASRIMEAAERVAGIEGSYPVLITSFMCSPDSFVLPYVRELWDKAGKPYLVLELDGHGSSVGYGTRVEAAVRSFRTHMRHRSRVSAASDDHLVANVRRGNRADLQGKTLLIPNWDIDVMTLVTASLRREGIDARLLEESDELIRQGSRISDGQCLPLSIIAKETAAYIRKHRLDPRKTLLWMVFSDWGCNIPMFPRHIQHLLKKEGRGMEHVRVHPDDIGFTATSPLSIISTYYAFMFGGILKRIGCRIRPYEVNPGETDKVLAMARDRLAKVFLGRGDRMKSVRDIVERLEAIPVRKEKRPKAAIFGDIYVRDNDVMNQDLIRSIEAAGGEVVTMPYNRYAKMIAKNHFQRLFNQKRYTELAGWKALLAAVKVLERSYDKLLTPLAGPEEKYQDDPAEILAPYGVTVDHHGESLENLLKVHYLSRRHDDLALFVQTSPAFCCAGLVTEAMRKRIEEVTGIPVVSITYDGTGGNKNDVVVPYITFPRNAKTSPAPDSVNDVGRAG